MSSSVIVLRPRVHKQSSHSLYLTCLPSSPCKREYRCRCVTHRAIVFPHKSHQLPVPKSSKLVLPQFGSEPRFKPEPGRTELKFSSRFKAPAEPNLRFSSRFSWTLDFLNQFKLVQTRFEPHLGWSRIPGPNSPLGYSRVPNQTYTKYLSILSIQLDLYYIPTTGVSTHLALSTTLYLKLGPLLACFCAYYIGLPAWTACSCQYQTNHIYHTCHTCHICHTPEGLQQGLKHAYCNSHIMQCI